MARAVLGLLWVAVLVCTSLAGEGDHPALRRGFENGRFVDEYYGIAYAAPGVGERSISGPKVGAVLWTGQAADGVALRVLVDEHSEIASGLVWHARLLEALEADEKTRTDIEKGTTPQPWILFAESGPAGTEQHHGYALFVRGYQCFYVHAQVSPKSAASGEALRKVLFRLTVSDKADSFLLADLLSAEAERDPRDPEVLANAGMQYMSAEPPLAGQALGALELALATAAGGLFTPEGAWYVHQALGLAQLTLGKVEASVPTWEKAVLLARGVEDPATARMHSYYNLACAYARLGRLDDAIKALKKSFRVGPVEGVRELKQHARTDSDLERARKHAGWAVLFGS